MSRIERFVALFDIHFGWEKKRLGGGRLVTRTTHDSRALGAVFEFVKDFKPDYLVLGGDNWNMSFISRHNRGKPRLVEGFRAVNEYKASDREVLKPLERMVSKKCKRVLLLGNHEHWVEQFLDENPSLEGISEPHEYLGLADRGWEIVSYGDTYKLGRLYIAHGDKVRGSGEYRARQILLQYQRNIMTGHVHTLQCHLNKSMADQQPHVSYCIPLLGRVDPEYLEGSPTNWVQGFAYGYLWNGGNFCVSPVVMTGHEFVANGKLYSGKKR